VCALSTRLLSPSFPLPATPPGNRAFDGAVWIGSFEVGNAEPTPDLQLEGGQRFSKARLLIWDADRVQGFVEVPVSAGTVAAADLEREVAALPRRTTDVIRVPLPPISVIVCTRDRPEDLSECLAALFDLKYPELEIIVVDNAPATDATRILVEPMADRGVRYIRADLPGLARARNVGARIARYGHLAFTDDDVIVDTRWLEALGQGFADHPDAGCVSGMVATGQLESRSQHYFDQRVGWSENIQVTRFNLDDPPVGFPLFPFQFGAYGTGANFAVKRSVLFELGGFDEALGVGSPTGGGEDIDWFVRVVLSGQTLLYQPDAVVWHKHRIDDASLATQLENYGVGLGAVITKLAANPKALRAMAPLMGRAVVHTWKILRVKETAQASEKVSTGNAYREFRGMLRAPLALHRARRDRVAYPLYTEAVAGNP
jgi:GT2 family glycosyltransferase